MSSGEVSGGGVGCEECVCVGGGGGVLFMCVVWM